MCDFGYVQRQRMWFTSNKNLFVKGLVCSQYKITANLLQPPEEPIITMVKKLAEHCLPAKDLENLKKMFDDPKKNKFMLSNEEVRLVRFDT